jgi:transcriptional regulator with XRE-family HTH domain
MFVLQEFGARLRSAREAAGLTQSQLGTFCGVSRQAVHAWEQGLSCPALENIAAISKRLRIRIDWMIFGLDPISIDTCVFYTEKISSILEDIEQHLQGVGKQLSPAHYAKLIDMLYYDDSDAQAKIEAIVKFAAFPR